MCILVAEHYQWNPPCVGVLVFYDKNTDSMMCHEAHIVIGCVVLVLAFEDLNWKNDYFHICIKLRSSSSQERQ